MDAGLNHCMGSGMIAGLYHSADGIECGIKSNCLSLSGFHVGVIHWIFKWCLTIGALVANIAIELDLWTCPRREKKNAIAWVTQSYFFLNFIKWSGTENTLQPKVDGNWNTNGKVNYAVKQYNSHIFNPGRIYTGLWNCLPKQTVLHTDCPTFRTKNNQTSHQLLSLKV